jgi:hypothetical protein
LNANGTPEKLVAPWATGTVWKPNGRPKGPRLTTLIRRALRQRELCGQPTPGNETVTQFLAEAMIVHAIKGNAAFMREILNCVDGPAQSVLPESERADNVVLYIPDNGRDRRKDDPVASEAQLDHWADERAKRLMERDNPAVSCLAPSRRID